MSTKNQPMADPSVAIPAAVKAAAAKADQLHKTAYNPDPLPAPTPDPAPTSDPTPPGEPVTLAGNEPPAEPAPAPAPSPALSSDEKSWEHKYNSMKGRYDKLAQQHRDEVRALSDQLASLEARMATLRDPSPAPAPTPERLITPEEEEAYGPDFLKIIGKKAKEEVGGEVAVLKGQIEGLTAQIRALTNSTARTARERMFDALDGSLTNWRDVNEDQEFLDWLALRDPLSGAIRHELLKSAFEQNDAPRVLNFFKGFLSEAAKSPAPSAEPDPEPKPSKKVPLESLAAPGRAKSAAGTPPASEKPTFTRKQIAAIYADIRAGKYRGREAEQQVLEEQIIEASRSGRVIG
jgi:hypothetical protein